MKDDPKTDETDGNDTQALAEIQSSRANDNHPPPTPDEDQATIVADPRNRLNHAADEASREQPQPKSD